MCCIISFKLVCVCPNVLCKHCYNCQGLGLEKLAPRSWSQDLRSKVSVSWQQHWICLGMMQWSMAMNRLRIGHTGLFCSSDSLHGAVQIQTCTAKLINHNGNSYTNSTSSSRPNQQTECWVHREIPRQTALRTRCPVPSQLKQTRTIRIKDSQVRLQGWVSRSLTTHQHN